ncbi:solute carrier family 46 member 3-like isoform X2 [Mercenaria mercenaria]|uniref:solute carrier family 46 member 3-like isoform X2 n=1 Tax=Mercenaria mercenaria TaxID=6596 RepID=UPI00234F7172|nr:solute carrier family 46 member 3-like isoform X2 [Mercenaria mercenaria]
MEGPNRDQDCEANENSPLLDPGEQMQNGTSSGPSVGEAVKGFTLRRSMIVPMCACYIFAGGIFMYIVPQYVQEVMKGNDERKLPGEIVPQNMYLLQSKGHATFNACSENKSDPSYEKFTKVQQDTARWMIYFNVAVLLPAMFANLVWTSYSDVFGRKFGLFLCLTSLTIRMTIFTIVVYFKLSLVYVIIGNIIDGLAGTYTSFFALLFSFVSDITYPGRQRTITIVVFELVVGLSFTISSLVSGHLIEQYGYFYPSVAISCLSVVGVVILIFLVPETMQNNQMQGQRSSVVKSIAESVKFYFCDGSKIKRAKYILLMLGFFFLGIPALSRMSLEVLYQLGRPFCWTSTKIGWFGAVKMAVSSLFGIGGVYLFKRCFADDTIAFYSLIFGAVAYVVEGLAKTDIVLYSVTVIAAPTGLSFPMIRSLMSCLTPADKQDCS